MIFFLFLSVNYNFISNFFFLKLFYFATYCLVVVIGLLILDYILFYTLKLELVCIFDYYILFFFFLTLIFVTDSRLIKFLFLVHGEVYVISVFLTFVAGFVFWSFLFSFLMSLKLDTKGVYLNNLLNLYFYLFLIFFGVFLGALIRFETQIFEQSFSFFSFVASGYFLMSFVTQFKINFSFFLVPLINHLSTQYSLSLLEDKIFSVFTIFFLEKKLYDKYVNGNVYYSHFKSFRIHIFYVYVLYTVLFIIVSNILEYKADIVSSQMQTIYISLICIFNILDTFIFVYLTLKICTLNILDIIREFLDLSEDTSLFVPLVYQYVLYFNSWGIF